MPKAKPTQVVVHRIELQEKERLALEAIVAGQTVKNVVVPVAVTGAVVSATYLSYKALKASFTWGEDIVDKVNEIKQRYEEEGILWEPEVDITSNFDGTVTNNETGETKKGYPLPYYWWKAVFN
jgi:hypothetical protein